MHLTVELPYARVPSARLYVRLQVMLGVMPDNGSK